MTDAVGSYITEATGQLMELRAFTQYAARNQLINESNQPVLITVRGAIQTLKETLHRLSGKRSYNTACARIETATPSDSQADVEKLRELFTVSALMNVSMIFYLLSSSYLNSATNSDVELKKLQIKLFRFATWH